MKKGLEMGVMVLYLLYNHFQMRNSVYMFAKDVFFLLLPSFGKSTHPQTVLNLAKLSTNRMRP